MDNLITIAICVILQGNMLCDFVSSVVVSCHLLPLQLHLDCEDLMMNISFVMPILQLSLFVVIVTMLVNRV